MSVSPLQVGLKMATPVSSGSAVKVPQDPQFYALGITELGPPQVLWHLRPYRTSQFYKTRGLPTLDPPVVL